MTAKTFDARCYDLLRKVPKGQVTTYRELAHALDSRAYRAVGSAMGRNPNAPQVPCHRVVRSNGEIGGYAHGAAKKVALLRKEGVRVVNGRVEDIDRLLFRFS